MPTRIQRPAVPSVDRSKQASPEKALDQLLAKAPQANPTTPYLAVKAGDIDAWLAKHFGPIEKMTPVQAEEAALLLEGVAPGIALGTRTHVFELVEKLNARAEEAEAPKGWGPPSRSDPEAALDRLVDSAPQLNPNVPYKAVSAGAVDAWLLKHFGRVDSMTPAQAKRAAELLDSVAPGIALGTRTHIFELVETLNARAQSAAKP